MQLKGTVNILTQQLQASYFYHTPNYEASTLFSSHNCKCCTLQKSAEAFSVLCRWEHWAQQYSNQSKCFLCSVLNIISKICCAVCALIARDMSSRGCSQWRQGMEFFSTYTRIWEQCSLKTGTGRSHCPGLRKPLSSNHGPEFPFARREDVTSTIFLQL